MSYFGRLLALARDNVSPLAMPAGGGPELAIVEQHELVPAPARPIPSPPPPASPQPITAAPALQLEETVEHAALPPPLHPPAPRPKSRDDAQARIEPSRAELPPRTATTPLDADERRALPTVPRASAPPPTTANAAPGLRVLRDVMHWITQGPGERPRAAQATPGPESPLAEQLPPPRSLDANDAIRPLQREAPRTPGPRSEDRQVDVSIGEIEVVIEPPAPATPRGAPEPPRARRRITTRDTRLARRLPRSG